MTVGEQFSRYEREIDTERRNVLILFILFIVHLSFESSKSSSQQEGEDLIYSRILKLNINAGQLTNVYRVVAQW